MEYTIIKKARTNFLDATGGGVDGYRIYYQMSDGLTDYVEIPKAQFSVDAVRQAIEEQIESHIELMS